MFPTMIIESKLLVDGQGDCPSHTKLAHQKSESTVHSPDVKLSRPTVSPGTIPPCRDVKVNRAGALCTTRSSPTTSPKLVASPLKCYWPDITYLMQCSRIARTTSTRDKVLILDLNGTLLYKRKSMEHDRYDAPVFILRPGLEEFLRFAFRNFQVMVWTTAGKRKARQLISIVFNPAQQRMLRATWTRESLHLSKEDFKRDVPVIKDLRMLWNSTGQPDSIATQENTILLDNEPGNACLQPFNLLPIQTWNERSEETAARRQLHGCMTILEMLLLESNVSFYLSNAFRSRETWSDLYAKLQ